MNKFDWDADPRIVVRHCDALAIWINPQGDVVISQHDPWDDRDPIISFPAEQARRVAARIQDLVTAVPQLEGGANGH